MNILVTAIGSMSAACVITQLKNTNNLVIGCDIYPKEWHYESSLCDYFYQVPYATNEIEYCKSLIKICKKHNINYIIPLTDLEIDSINKNRELFTNIILCIPDSNIIEIVRNKYKLYKYFKDDSIITVPTTWYLNEYKIRYNNIVAKLINGRSSQGLLIKPTFEQLMALNDKFKYIVQQYIDGNVCTIDYCRSAKYKNDAIIAREELLRTTNGAGLTVKMFTDLKLNEIVSYIGKKLNINGAICIEFIKNKNDYYLIDINPRFSAGIEFSLLSGYDMANNHLNCFNNKQIDCLQNINEKILIKKYDTIVSNIS